MKPRNQVIYDTIILSILYALLVIAWIVACENSDAQALPIELQITQAAKRHGLEPSLLLAMAEVESRMNPDVIGSLGEIGLFQLRPEYHRVSRGDSPGNIETAARYLVKLKRECREYGDAFFVCYNYGPARRLKYPKRFPYYLKVKAAIERRERTNALAARD